MNENKSYEEEYIDYDAMAFLYRILEKAFTKQTGELIGEIESRIRREVREETQNRFRNIYDQMIMEQQEQNQILSDCVLKFLAGPDLQEYQPWILRWVIGFLGHPPDQFV